MLTALQKIKAILDTISSDVLPFKFEYLKSMPTSFPAGCVMSMGFTESYIDQQYNDQVETFDIKLIFAEEESQAGYEKWMTLVDLVSATFRKDDHQTLTGTAVDFRIRQCPAPTFSNEYAQPIIIFDIIVDARIIKSITT
jgi:hypothetical protein